VPNIRNHHSSGITGELLATVDKASPILVARFSPDGLRCIAAGLDHTASIWSAVNGRLLATVRGHTAEVSDFSFSPDGRN